MGSKGGEETQLTPLSHEPAEPTTEEVPGLTILAHADRSRVGERLALPALAAASDVLVARQEPVFRAPRSWESRPLGDRSISRRHLRFTPGDEPGGVNLELGDSRTRVAADGRPVERRRAFTAAEIERGLALQLGRRTVLLLHRLPLHVPKDTTGGFGLVGDSRAMVEIRREINRLADLDVAVLLRGATGTGKELVARALHRAGPRQQRPFVAVNMATLSPSLAAAELFGAVRGAYTGAGRARAGFFEAADGGTLFLDEIGETPSEVQPMLLRALEEREILPVGAVEPRRVDVRIIAATDTHLGEAAASG
ncbi:MAG: sigma-54 factor interaction domain-containing protein, partial [Holophagales bacterium]|nr:sigma-54 factor interaction domain-containing protein [Holophagales bacterium]